jgi:uncharacterized protein (TIGR00369 family)
VSGREEIFSPAYGSLETLRSLAEVWNGSPQMRHFGARLEFERLDRVLAVIDPVQDFHRGGLGTEAVNGVVLAGLFDLAIGTVGWLTRPDARTATVSLAMSFLRPTRGPRVVAEARLIRRGLNLIFAAAEIVDASGEVTARCDGTCAVAMGHTESEFTARMRVNTPTG